MKYIIADTEIAEKQGFKSITHRTLNGGELMILNENELKGKGIKAEDLNTRLLDINELKESINEYGSN